MSKRRVLFGSLPFSLLFFFVVVIVLVKLAQLKCEEQEDESCSRPGVFLIKSSILPLDFLTASKPIKGREGERK